MSKRLVAIIMLVSLAGFTFACSRGDSSPGAEGTESSAGVSDDAANPATQEMVAPAPSEVREAAGSDGSDASVGVAQAPDTGIPPIPESGVPGSTRVIKNINLEIEIKEGEFQRQFTRASTLAEQFQGFVAGSQVSQSEEGELASGTLTIRVPSNRFEEAVSRLKSLGDVTGEGRSSQDVSREFVDLEARLNHAQTEEAFFLKLMAEAETVSDLIQVQSQLSGTQLRIEEIQGQLQYLRDQTSFSTITANIYEPGAGMLGDPKPLAEAWEEAVHGFQSVVSGAVVGFGWTAPFLLIGVVGVIAYRWTKRPRKLAEKPEPSI